MPMDERFRAFQNRQQDVHVRDTGPDAIRRIGGRGLAIGIGIVAGGLLVLIFALAR
jgi:hypothetical protein